MDPKEVNRQVFRALIILCGEDYMRGIPIERIVHLVRELLERVNKRYESLDVAVEESLKNLGHLGLIVQTDIAEYAIGECYLPEENETSSNEEPDDPPKRKQTPLNRARSWICGPSSGEENFPENFSEYPKQLKRAKGRPWYITKNHDLYQVPRFSIENLMGSSSLTPILIKQKPKDGKKRDISDSEKETEKEATNANTLLEEAVEDSTSSSEEC